MPTTRFTKPSSTTDYSPTRRRYRKAAHSRRRAGSFGIAYDQIAWFKAPHDGALKFRRLAGDTFPWDRHVLQGAEGDTTFRISDHYPLWVEFSVREGV